MKDRQSLYPNRIKFTDENTNTEYVGTWEFADQPSVEGTMMNKAAFMKDATATALGLTQADPTVDDALAKLAAHKSRHATGGADALTPQDIGAAPLSALSSYIQSVQKGAASGVASLDANSKVAAAQASSSYISISGNTTLSDTHAGKTLLVGADATLTVGTMTDGSEIEIWNTGSYTVTVSGTVFVAGEGAVASCTVDENSVCVLKVMNNTVYVAGGVSV